jgi:hypothetical protein
MEAVETFTRGFCAADIAALSHRIKLAPQPGTQLAKVEVKLKDGRALGAQADRRDRQIPSIDKMGDKLRALTKGAWAPERATSVIGILTEPLDGPVAVLSALLRR